MIPFAILKSKTLIIGAVCLSVGLFSGYKTASWKCDSERLKAIERALQEQAEQQAEIDEIEQSYWEDQLRQNVKWKTIEKEVVRYVKDNGSVECLTDDGVQLWNSANPTKDSTKPTR